MSSGWRITPLDSVKNSSIYHHMPSGWLSWSWYHILMSYDNVITSSRYNTLPFVGHPNEIANFGCSQHAVVIQHFRRFVPCPESNSLFLIWPPEILSIAAVLYWLADAFNEKFYCRLTTVKFEKKNTWTFFLMITSQNKLHWPNAASLASDWILGWKEIEMTYMYVPCFLDWNLATYIDGIHFVCQFLNSIV